MSVQSQIDRINQNVANTYAVLDALGADMPAEQNSDNLATTAGSAKAVLYSEQNLTPEQKAQARVNIDAAKPPLFVPVTATEDDITTDVSFAEIAQAYDEDRPIHAILNEAIRAELYMFTENTAFFVAAAKTEVLDIIIYANGNIETQTIELASQEALEGKLDVAELSEAINTALAQAKASGEFKGEPGQNGTSVTVSNVSESTADGGSNVVTFSDGKTLTVKNGSKGSKGDTGATGATGQRGTGLLPVTTAPSSYTTAVGGITPKYRMAISTIKTEAGVTEVLLGDTVRYSYYHYPIDYLDSSYAYFTTRVSIRGATGAAGTTPVKGTDYFTEAEKAAMVQEVIEAIGLNIIGEVDNANNILITVPLPDGNYTLKYENADGSVTDIGTLKVTSAPAYTNLADPASSDWLTNKRINSSKNVVDVTETQRGDKTVVVTNMIPISGVKKLHIKGLDIINNLVNGSSNQNYGRVYDYNGTTLVGVTYQPSTGLSSTLHYTFADYDSSVLVFDIATMLKQFGGAHTSATHVRLGGILTGAAEDVIITADENIV